MLMWVLQCLWKRQSPQSALPNSSLSVNHLCGCSQAASSAHSGLSLKLLTRAAGSGLFMQEPSSLCCWPALHGPDGNQISSQHSRAGGHRLGCNVFLCFWDESPQGLTHFMPRYQRKHPSIPISCCLNGKGKRGAQLLTRFTEVCLKCLTYKFSM